LHRVGIDLFARLDAFHDFDPFVDPPCRFDILADHRRQHRGVDPVEYIERVLDVAFRQLHHLRIQADDVNLRRALIHGGLDRRVLHDTSVDEDLIPKLHGREQTWNGSRSTYRRPRFLIRHSAEIELLAIAIQPTRGSDP